MKRSTIIVIVILFVSVLIGGLLGFYFYINSKTAKNNTIGTRVETGGSFGTNLNTSITLPGNASTTQPEQTPVVRPEPEAIIPVLRKVFAGPVSGAAFFTKEIFATTTPLTETIVVAKGTTTAKVTNTLKPGTRKLLGKVENLLFVERLNGHIYETATSTLIVTKTSNTTVPKVYEALFIGRESLLLRGLYQSSDVITTIFGSQQLLTPTSTEKTLITKNLPNNLKQAVLSPNKNKIFFIQNNAPIGVVSNPDGSNAVGVFSSPFTEWIAGWPNEQKITLTTKASVVTDGFMYSVNPTSKEVRKILGGKKGLTTLMSPDGLKVMYSESVSGSSYLYVFDVATQSSRPLFFRTFAEKCVWSNKDKDTAFCAVPQDIAFGDYPDVWYQGRILFNDKVWKINTKTGETQLIATLNELTTEAIDAINPVLNTDDTYLTFNNKADLSLWGLKLIPETTKAATPGAAASN